MCEILIIYLYLEYKVLRPTKMCCERSHFFIHNSVLACLDFFCVQFYHLYLSVSYC